MAYIVAIDQGTTSSRAVLFNEKGEILGVRQKEFTQYFPKSGWVEHDPEEIWSTQYEVFRSLLNDQQLAPDQIDAIGITNQRETTVVWDADSGEPVYNAIVWQDKRTSDFCESLKSRGLEEKFREKTGLVIDSYFSGTKVHWILENVERAKELADEGRLRMGTIDTWLIWKMTKGKRHVTDHTNASRTLLFNINEIKWDSELLEIFGIPGSMLPEVYGSAHHFGDFEFKGASIPILGVAGDQQAALFGQACYEKGDAKNTYGTGCFMLMNMGEQSIKSKHGLLTTLACSVDEKPVYAFEGSIFIAGAAVQWLRDALRVIDHAEDSEYFAGKVTTHEVFMVPAFAGMGAPYWDQYSRGAIFGLTRDTGKNHLIKATLESIAYQTKDVLNAMEEDAGIKISSLMVDGGATANEYLMQFQSDILGIDVDRPEITESTALGAAFLAGLKAEIWNLNELKKIRRTNKRFKPKLDAQTRSLLYESWKKAVNRTLNWMKE